MTAAEARALAMAYELQQLLGELDAERNPRIEFARDLMEEVLGHLDTGTGERSARMLRLLVTEPREYERERTARALRLLASTPWKRP